MCPNCGSKSDNDYCIKCGYFKTKDINEHHRSFKLPKFNFIFFIFAIIFCIISSFFINDYIKRSRIVPVDELKQDISSDNYVNELYISSAYAYNYLLNNDQKEVYKIFLNKIINFETELNLDLSDKGFSHSYFSNKYFIEVNDAILIDHPELIHFAYISYQRDDNYKYKIKFNYVLSENEYKYAIKEIKNILEQIKTATQNMKDSEKVKYVYEWIGKNNKYDTSKLPIAQSAYSVFNKNLSPVCSGYARSSQIIFQYIGINSLIIKGDYKNVSHEWNFVKLDNQYYYYDVTSSNNEFYSGLLFKDHKGYHIKYKKITPMALGKKHIIK